MALRYQHGKGVVDGIGGTVKRSVWRAHLAGEIITDATQFYEVATEKCKNIDIQFVQSKTIEEYQGMLDSHWEGISAHPDTKVTHTIRPLTP